MPHPSSSVSNLRLIPRNPSNSTPAHNAVAAALSHKHHPVINVGAGPIQLGHGPPLHPAADAIHQKVLFSPFSPVSFQSVIQRISSVIVYLLMTAIFLSMRISDLPFNLDINTSDMYFLLKERWSKCTTSCRVETPQCQIQNAECLRT